MASTFLLAILSGLAAGLTTSRVTSHLARTSPILRRNYRGIEVPAAMGIAPILGLVAGCGVVAVVRALFSGSASIQAAALHALPVCTAALGFGLFGLWDDIAGGSQERGWRAHLSAVRHARASAGAIKLVAGVALAFIVATFAGEGLAWTILNAGVIAMSANLFNLFDMRPGRAGKMFLLAAAPLIIFGGSAAVPVVAAAAAVAMFLPFDLRERAMLGDTGANALGAVIGWSAITVTSHSVRLGVFLILALLQVAGDKPGFSRLFASVKPLTALDRAGRAPE